MHDEDLPLNLGMLCRCCDYRSYQLPEVEGLTDDQRRRVEELCKLCIESFKPAAVNG